MGWLRNLFRREPSADAFAQVHWLEATDPKNPFKVRLLNCLPVSQTMMSTTSDQHVAARFLERRRNDGRRHCAQTPEDPLEVHCRLQYPIEGEGLVADGPLHKSSEMEDKWDIYLHDGFLYFARSWTGDLVARCAVSQA